MADKSLKFSFSLDEASFSRVKRAIQELTTEMQKFARAAAGVGTSGGGGPGGAGGTVWMGGKPPSAAQQVAGAGGGGFGKIALDQSRAFQTMAQTGTQALRGLTESVRRSVSDQQQQIRGLQTSIEALGRSYGKLSNAGPGGPWPGGAGSGGAGGLGSVTPAPFQFPFGGGGGGKPGGRGGGAGWWSGGWNRFGQAIGFNNFMTSNGAGGYLSPFGVGAAVASGFKVAEWGMKGYVDTQNLGQNLVTSRGGVVNPEIRKLMGGDISYILALNSMRRYGGGKFQAGQDATVGKYAQGAGMLGTLPGAIGVGLTGASIGIGPVGFTVPLTSLSQGALTIEDKLAGNQFQKVQEWKDNAAPHLLQQMAYERFQSDLSSRVSAQRIMGSSFGYRRTMGKYEIDDSDVGEGKTEDVYNKKKEELEKRGYDMGQWLGGVQQSRALGMGGRHADEIMAAGAAGWGGWGSVLQRAARGGSEGMAYAALGGGINTAAGLELGQSVLGFNPRGTTTGEGVLAAAQGGFKFTGGVEDMNTSARIQLGLQAGGALSGGFDPYQRGRNIISAGQLMPGATTRAQDYLATGMDFKQLLDAGRGSMTATGTALGITSDIARRQVGNIATSMFARFADTGGGDPMSRAIRRFRASGQDAISYLQNLKSQPGGIAEAQALGAYIGQETGQGEEGGLGLVGLLGGIDNKTLTKGFVPVGKPGSIEQKALDTTAAATKKMGEITAEWAEEWKKAYDQVIPTVKTMASFGQTFDTSAAKFVGALNELATAITAVSRGGRPAPYKGGP